MNWYVMVLKRYAEFNGRSRRQEYWMFVLFNIIFAFLFSFIDGFVGTMFLYPLYALGVFIPGLAVAVRRLHDIDKSGWMMLIGLIPLIGGIWLIVLLATDGTRGRNQYGDDPKNPIDEINDIGVEEV